jgi:hypothetical protein
MICPYCRARNMAGAGFCIECGEPLDGLRAGDAWAGEDGDSGAVAPPWSWRERRLELVLGLALLMAVVGFALFNYLGQEAQAGKYRSGVAALERGDLESAVTDLQAAGDYLDSGKRVAEARERIRERGILYRLGSEAFASGRMWQAARVLAQLDAQSPGFVNTSAMLTEARRDVGVIAYRLGPWADGDGALYVAHSDGRDAQRVPDTNRLTKPEALSTDGKWLLYSDVERSGYNVPSGPGARTVYLYSVAGRYTRRVATLEQSEHTGASIGFTRDGMAVSISTGASERVFALPAEDAHGCEHPLPEATPAPRANRNDRYHTLVLESVDHGTAVMVGDENGSNEVQVAVESVEPDGAIFSQDGRYLMYRVCGAVLQGAAPGCALRLVDLNAGEPRPVTLASLPNKREGDRRNTLAGEFTRDDKHVFVLSRYNGESEAHLYDTAAGELRRVEAGVALEDGPLVSLLAPGITSWVRPNSLAFTDETVQFDSGPGGGDVPYYRIKSHWVEISPGDRYMVYIAGDDTGPETGNYTLYAVALDGPAAPKPLLRISARLYDWRYSGYLLPEGKTLVTLLPPTPQSARGLYAYDLATGAATLLVPDATEMLEPGPRRYTMGDYLGR